MKKAEMKALIQSNQQFFRNRGPWHSKFLDDGFEKLHPLRIEPLSQISPDELFRQGLYYTGWNKTPTTTHVMTHLHRGLLIDPRAWILASTITDENLVLEHFRPGTMSDPGGEHQLGNMRDMLRAWFWY